MNLLEAVDNPHLFAPWFKDPETWIAWRAFIAALFGLPMTDEQVGIFRAATGLQNVPEATSEAWLVVGRRGGKSFVVALIAVYLACLRDYHEYLQPGERGTVVIVAATKSQAKVILRYIAALIENVPVLAELIEARGAESLDLTNGISIEVHAASFRSIRGRTVVAALLDEIAFWRSDDSANPDREILNALRPAMATIPGSKLLAISSPYARYGVLWETYRDHFGKPGDVLVWQAESRVMNPTISQKHIDREYERDPVSAAAEYGAQFRSDVAGFLPEAWVDAAVIPGVFEIEPRPGTQYYAFTDPSGGGKDAFTLAIAHNESGCAILDCVRSRKPPFSPEAVVADFADVMTRYGISRVTGDCYAGRWVVDAFLKVGITYQHSDKSKSEIYLEAEPMFATGKVKVIDHKKLLSELRQLERRAGKSGRDSVDHPPGGSDDVINSAAGALLLANKVRGSLFEDWDDSDLIDDPYHDPVSAACARYENDAAMGFLHWTHKRDYKE